MDERTVIVTKSDDPRYPRTAPFHPDRSYPEYAFGEAIGPERNPAYESVRRALSLAGLDAMQSQHARSETHYRTFDQRRPPVVHQDQLLVPEIVPSPLLQRSL